MIAYLTTAPMTEEKSSKIGETRFYVEKSKSEKFRNE